jgi:flagellar M-ring protein FliF
MQEQFQKLINRVREEWYKFTSRQKTIIIAVAAGITMTLVVLVALFNQVQYVHLLTATDAGNAAEVRDLLQGGDIRYRVSSDGMRFEVDKKQEADAIMLMGSNNILAAGWSIDNVTTGGFSTTEADKQKRYVVYLEKYIGDMALAQNSVKSATVKLTLPDNDGTLLSQDKDATAWITLGITSPDEFTEDQAANLAKCVAVGLGSSSPKGITIIDTDGNMLFDGESNYASSGGSASSQLSTKSKAEAVLNSEIRKVLQGVNEFDKVVVASNLALDFSSTTSTDHEYYYGDGMTSGYLVQESTYESESTMGGGGVPGTDSNTEDTSYQFQNNSESSSTESESQRDWVVSERITNLEIPPGAIKLDQSSLSVTATSYNNVHEEDIRRQGLLDGITWDEYKFNNSEPTVLDVDEEVYNVVVNASGIARDSITIRAYSENIFVDAERFSVTWTDAAQIFLIIVILGLLAFVVLRSMRSEKEEVMEEELSIEDLLTSQPELEHITVDEGSESKLLIDKFVEDNPEAAASLLRNWLNEEWG